MVDKRKMMFRQEKNDSGATKIYIYDNVTAQGPFIGRPGSMMNQKPQQSIL